MLKNNSKGAVAVEMAITLPLVALLIMGAIDLGLMTRAHQVIQNACREGARFSSLQTSLIDADRNPGFTAADITSRVVTYCTREGVTVLPTDVSVTQNETIIVNGISVPATRVSASASYTFITPGLSGLLGPVTLWGQGLYRNLY